MWDSLRANRGSVFTNDIKINDIVEEGVEEAAMFEDMVDETTEEGFSVDDAVTPTESYGSFQIPQTVEEPSLDESLPLDVSREHITSYEVVSSGSQRCVDILVDNQGYSFTVKKRNVSSVSWRCKVINKLCNCKATVI